jgi:protein-tyrosine phosphatase
VNSSARAAQLSQLDVAEVAKNLWIGAAPPEGEIVGEHWDVLVLCANDWQPSSSSYPGVKVLHAPFRDTLRISTDELKTAMKAAGWTAKELAEGKKVLVTCIAGRNRSGLVTAAALSFVARMDPAKAGEVVRERRGSAALTNSTFVNFLNAMRRNPCELCQGKRVMPRFYEDHACWLTLCKTCRVPMAVLRRHSTKPTAEERQFMVESLFKIGDKLAPGQAWKLDLKRRTIPSHWHAHLRPA